MVFKEYTVATLLRLDDSIYLSQRVNTNNFDGKWQCAGGGVEKGENPIDAAAREVKEETDLDIIVKRLRYIGGIYGDPTCKVCYVYFVNVNDTEIPIRKENKSTDWVLFSYDEALKLDSMPGLKESIEKLRKL